MRNTLKTHWPAFASLALMVLAMTYVAANVLPGHSPKPGKQSAAGSFENYYAEQEAQIAALPPDEQKALREVPAM